VKFGRAVFQLCEHTDRQTNILITILRIPPGSEVIKTNNLQHKTAYAFLVNIIRPAGKFVIMSYRSKHNVTISVGWQQNIRHTQ